MSTKRTNKVYGVGINDATYNISKGYRYYEDGKNKTKEVWRCPYYIRWKAMLDRVYNKKFHSKAHTYTACTVDKNWLTFSNFRDWLVGEESKLGNIKEFHVDKDLLKEGNKHYSSETCVLVHRKVNQFMKDNKLTRGECLLGSSWCKSKGKYISCINNPFTLSSEYLGSFDTDHKAHVAWKKRKDELACKLANSKYVTDLRIKEKLLTYYK